MARRLRLVLLVGVWLVGSVLVARSASAQTARSGQDYDPDSDAWTGLSGFVDLAHKQGVALDVVDKIDWSKINRDDVLLFVYPTKPLQIANAANFVIDGGHMLVADDFGASPSFLQRLDVSRVTVAMGRLPHDTFVDGNHALPIFHPTGRHPLLDGVDTVVANHPAVLLNVGGPVISYADGSGLVYDMNLGKGKVVVVGDASLLINHMLDVGDNAVLAQNTLAYLCRDRSPCHAKLIVRDFDQYGEYTATESDDDGTDSISAQIDAFNDAVRDFMRNLPTERLLYFLGILLAGGLGLYLAAVFRLRAPRPYSAYIDNTTRHVPDPQSEFDWNLSRFGSGGRETNYALPLAILKEIFEEIVLSDLGYWPINAERRPSIQELGAAVRAKYFAGRPDADKLEQEVVDLLAVYARIPTRHRVFLDSDAYFGERDLIRIYRRTRRVLRLMGLEEDYERRTRSLV